MSDTKKPETPDYVSMQRVDEIDAKLQQVLAHNPAPWRQVLPIMPYNVEDANGEDVALAQMQRVPGQTSCLTGAQARINLSALLGQTPTMLQELIATVRHKEAQLDEITDILGSIDSPNQHEDMLRRILDVVMRDSRLRG